MHVSCDTCERKAQFTVSNWRCHCGYAWEPVLPLRFDADMIDSAKQSLWRYGKLLGIDVQEPAYDLGGGWTPLVKTELSGRSVYLKLEYLSLSGSFKDRGVSTMINQLSHMGITQVVEDSSGNAGASLAAYAARYNIKAQIFVPSYASRAKLHQIEVYGAKIEKIPGPRSEAGKAAIKAISPTKAYASHAYDPAYLAGQVTAAYELWEQLGRKCPDWVLCPVGQGGQFIGYWMGFKLLQLSELIDRLPRMVAIQSYAVDPVYQAWIKGLVDVPDVSVKGSSIAEGVMIQKPVRGKRLLQALKETNGIVLTISDDDLINAQKAAAHKGFYIEPTSALVVAGLYKMNSTISSEQSCVLSITGNGLKGAPRY